MEDPFLCGERSCQDGEISQPEDSASEGSNGMDRYVRHEAQRWNERKALAPVQAGTKSLGRSVRWMQAGGEIAGPERYWCGAMPTAKRPGLTEREYGESKRSECRPTGNHPPVT